MKFKRIYFSLKDKTSKLKSNINDVKGFLKDSDSNLGKFGKLYGASKIASAAVNLYNGLNLASPSKLNPEESSVINKKLRDIAAKQGTDIVQSDTMAPTYLSKKSLDLLRRKVEAMRKKGLSDSEIEAKLKKKGILGSILTRIKDDAVILKNGKGTKLEDPAVLAHELGHSSYIRKDGTGGKIGRTAHKIYHSRVGSLIKSGTPIASFINGIHSGIKEEKAIQEGKKASKWNRSKTYIVPLAMSAPMLVSEAAASKKGLELLKNSGASRELLKESKKSLAKTYGTYLARAGRSVISGEAGRMLGKGWVRYKNKKQKQKQE